MRQVSPSSASPSRAAPPASVPAPAPGALSAPAPNPAVTKSQPAPALPTALSPPMTPSREAGDKGDSEDVCFICLQAGSESNPLTRPCSCPRGVHRLCAAWWQLQQAGRKEETLCRFCNERLPDWKQSLMAATSADGGSTQPLSSPPVVLIRFKGVAHKVVAAPGEDGKRKFQEDIRRLFQLPDEALFEVAFTCRDSPDSSTPGCLDGLALHGLSAYDAAAQCAAFMAAKTRTRGAQQQAAAATTGGHAAAGGGGSSDSGSTYDMPASHHRAAILTIVRGLCALCPRFALASLLSYRPLVRMAPPVRAA